MTQYHEGQEVEVLYTPEGAMAEERRFQDKRATTSMWRKATIASNHGPYPLRKGREMVAFPDGTHATFDTDHIREVMPPFRMKEQTR
jgi:hypothetical protein